MKAAQVKTATLTERAAVTASHPRAATAGGMSPSGNAGEAARSVKVALLGLVLILAGALTSAIRELRRDAT